MASKLADHRQTNGAPTDSHAQQVPTRQSPRTMMSPQDDEWRKPQDYLLEEIPKSNNAGVAVAGRCTLL